MRLLTHLTLFSFLLPISALSQAKSQAQTSSPASPSPATPLPTPRPAPIVSPEIGADRRVTFRLRAPGAQKVKLWGDWGGETELVKTENGVWSATVGPLSPDLYGYSFNVDGLTMLDPQNTAVKPSRSINTSVLNVPGAKVVPLDALAGVARGVVHNHEYESKALGTARKVRVYTPAEYGARGKTRFPILYLLHGSGDNEAVWTEFGRAHTLFDNLIAAKKIVPMIVVMPDGHAFMGQSPDSRARNVVEFERDLLLDVMPLVETNYRVKKGRNFRAIAGLSMGGNQALLIGLNHRDLFSHIGAFSSAIRERETPLKSFWADPNSKKTPLKLWIAIGKDDYLLADNRAFKTLLEERKVPHQYLETDGAHTWTLWRRYLADFAPRLFAD